MAHCPDLGIPCLANNDLWINTFQAVVKAISLMIHHQQTAFPFKSMPNISQVSEVWSAIITGSLVWLFQYWRCFAHVPILLIVSIYTWPFLFLALCCSEYNIHWGYKGNLNKSKNYLNDYVVHLYFCLFLNFKFYQNVNNFKTQYAPYRSPGPHYFRPYLTSINFCISTNNLVTVKLLSTFISCNAHI